jgi:5-methylcytosine-specific restriction protein A
LSFKGQRTMGKLSRLPPHLAPSAPRLGYAAGDEKARDKKRSTDKPWRNWYKTPGWAKLRHQVFLRDRYLCQRSQVLCIGKHPAPNSPVANHKQPHRGDPALFWDIDNIETVSKAVHDTLIQKEEQSTLRGVWD